MYEPRDLSPNLSGIDYGDSTAQRVLLVMCLDTSQSMSGDNIQRLNNALAEWAETLHRDVNLSATAEIAMVTFGANGVVIWRGPEMLPPRSEETPFVPAAKFRPPVLKAAGVTPMTEAVELAMTLVEVRKQQLRKQHLQYYRPLVWLITDGLPSDTQGNYSTDWKRLPPILESAQREKRFRFFAVGVDNLDKTGREVLTGLSPHDNYVLGGFPVHELLVYMSASMEQAARGNADFTTIDWFQVPA